MKYLLLFVFALESSLLASDLEERLDELEIQSLLDTITLNGEFTMRTDHVYKKNPAEKDSSFNLNRIKFRLNLSSNVSDRFTFHTRITATKATNEIVGASPDETSPPINRDQPSRTYRSAGIFLERAFFNYKLTESLTLSGGRLPTIEGGPYHFQRDSSAMGTYPQLAYANSFDGYALTYSWTDWTARFLYHPLTTVSRDPLNTMSPAFRFDGKEIRTDQEFLTGMVDYSTNNLGIARTLNSTLQVMRISGYTLDDPLVGLIPGATGGNVSFQYLETVLYLELNHLFDTNFYFSATMANSTIDSKGVWDSTVAPVGFVTNKPEDTVTGQATLLTLNYKIPSQSLNLGLEAFQASEGFQYFNDNPDDPIRMLSTRGSAFHLYTIYSFEAAFKTRLGYMLKQPEYSEGIIGGPTKLEGAEWDQSSTYLEFYMLF